MPWIHKEMQSKSPLRAAQQGRLVRKRIEIFAQVVADLAVAEGREGEYKAGIYQFPIDYTKVPLFQISLFTLFLCRRTTATQSTRVDGHWWTWRNRRGCCSFPAPTRSSWKSRR